MKPHRAMRRAAMMRKDFRFTRDDVIKEFEHDILMHELLDEDRAAEGKPPIWADEIARMSERRAQFLAQPVDPQKVFYSDAEFWEIIGSRLGDPSKAVRGD